MKVLPIGGTWSWRGDLEDHRGEWWHPESPFNAFLQTHGVEHLYPKDPFVWSSRVNGGIFWMKDHTDWMAGGAALSYYLGSSLYGPMNVPLEDRNVIAHSHAGQVVAYACAFRGVELNTVITVASPVRHDMKPIYKAARPRIRKWLHLYSDWSDRMQALGSWFDGQWGVQRVQPCADVNHRLPGVGHSKILRDPAYFPLWVGQGWIDWLKT